MTGILELDGAYREIDIKTAPKRTCLWLWIEMVNGEEFEATYPGLDIFGMTFPLTVDLRGEYPGDKDLPYIVLERSEVERITVLMACGAQNRWPEAVR